MHYWIYFIVVNQNILSHFHILTWMDVFIWVIPLHWQRQRSVDYWVKKYLYELDNRITLRFHCFSYMINVPIGYSDVCCLIFWVWRIYYTILFYYGNLYAKGEFKCPLKRSCITYISVKHDFEKLLNYDRVSGCPAIGQNKGRKLNKLLGIIYW